MSKKALFFALNNAVISKTHTPKGYSFFTCTYNVCVYVNYFLQDNKVFVQQYDIICTLIKLLFND